MTNSNTATQVGKALAHAEYITEEGWGDVSSVATALLLSPHMRKKSELSSTLRAYTSEVKRIARCKVEASHEGTLIYPARLVRDGRLVSIEAIRAAITPCANMVEPDIAPDETWPWQVYRNGWYINLYSAISSHHHPGEGVRKGWTERNSHGGHCHRTDSGGCRLNIGASQRSQNLYSTKALASLRLMQEIDERARQMKVDVWHMYVNAVLGTAS